MLTRILVLGASQLAAPLAAAAQDQTVVIDHLTSRDFFTAFEIDERLSPDGSPMARTRRRSDGLALSQFSGVLFHNDLDDWSDRRQAGEALACIAYLLGHHQNAIMLGLESGSTLRGPNALEQWAVARSCGLRVPVHLIGRRDDIPPGTGATPTSRSRLANWYALPSLDAVHSWHYRPGDDVALLAERPVGEAHILAFVDARTRLFELETGRESRISAKARARIVDATRRLCATSGMRCGATLVFADGPRIAFAGVRPVIDAQLLEGVHGPWLTAALLGALEGPPGRRLMTP